MTYRFTYRCRLCGETFDTAFTNHRGMALKELSQAIVFGEKTQITKETLHACNENNIGVADLIGVKADEV